MEQTRLILIIALSFLGLLLWEAWQKDYHQPPVTENNAPRKPQIEASSPPIAPVVPSASIPEISTSPAPSVTVTTDLLEIKINLTGGVIESASLRNYPAESGTADNSFRLFDNSAQRFFVEQGGLKADTDSPDHYANFTSSRASYKLEPSENELKVQLLWTSPIGIEVTKTFSITRGSYVVNISYDVANSGREPWGFNHYEQLQRAHRDVTQYFIHTFTGAAISSPEQRYEKYSYDDLVETPVSQDITNGWAAILEHYFVTAIIPTPEISQHFYSSAINATNYAVGFYGPRQEVKPGEQVTVSTKLYVGPKLQDVLPKIAPGLELTVDYGILWFIGKLLFSILSFLHGLSGNWGWAIIFLTCIVKLVFFPLSAAGYRSMANMRRVQPRLLAIRERYTNDRPRLNQAMMDLYKEEKINPLGGCFPILVQIPVFISLYWVILESVELRQAPWILWIKDLSTMDPWFVLPVLMTISMWLQSKLNPAPLDPIQAKVMQIMPFAFGIFFAFFPSGLVLYWFINNVLSIAQQWYITRAIEKTQ